MTCLLTVFSFTLMDCLIIPEIVLLVYGLDILADF